MPVKTFALHSVKIFLKKETALRATHGFLKLDGTIIPEVPRDKHNAGQKSHPVLKTSKPRVFRMALNERTEQAP